MKKLLLAGLLSSAAAHAQTTTPPKSRLENVLDALAASAKTTQPSSQTVSASSAAVPFNPDPTTVEEYNYASKGLRTMFTEGLDMKAGYTLLNKTVATSGQTQIITFDMVRLKDKALAGVAIVLSNPNWTSGDMLYCIPNAKAPTELWNQFFASIPSNELRAAVMVGLAFRLSAVETARPRF